MWKYIQSTVSTFRQVFASMSQKIDKLTIELEVVKSKKIINTNDISSEKEIKCDLCEYTVQALF